jgi:hypothetical protein
MKRLLIALALVAAVALVAAPLAVAHGHGQATAKGHGKSQVAHGHGRATAKGHAKFQSEATVVSADTMVTPNTLTVTILNGSKTIKSERGQQITVTVAQNAKLIDDTSSQPLTVGSLVAGEQVHLAGTVDTTQNPAVFTVTRIILQQLPVVPSSSSSPSVSPTSEPSDSPATT